MSLDTQVSRVSDYLANVPVTFCVCGGIGAMETPRIVRELRRHGATVKVWMTEQATRFVTPDALEWASGMAVVIGNPPASADHVVSEGMVVVVPATADMLGKIAHGFCSDGVSTLVQSAMGSNLPLVLLPSMHDSMYSSPQVKENREKISKYSNCNFLNSRHEEQKQKIPSPEVIGFECSHIWNRHRRQKNLKVCVTLGGTRVMIDSVRCLTNCSTGELGRLLCLELYALGCSIDAFVSQTENQLPELSSLHTVRKSDYKDMLDQLSVYKTHDLHGIMHLMAGSDFICDALEEKISSSEPFLFPSMVQAPKFIELPNLKNVPYKMACKLTDSASSRKKSVEFLEKHKLNLLLWNTVQSAFSVERQEAVFLHSDSFEHRVVGKKKIASYIASHFLKMCGEN